MNEEAPGNPDQRMTGDIAQLNTTTLSFILMIANGTLTVLSFLGVLGATSSKLFIVAIVYALAGTGLVSTTLLGAFALVITQFQAISSYAAESGRTRNISVGNPSP